VSSPSIQYAQNQLSLTEPISFSLLMFEEDNKLSTTTTRIGECQLQENTDYLLEYLLQSLFIFR